ncbi:MAG: hypothetical protein Q7S55_00040 [Nanoarchaeota archaeon]|nr:hypothetical protein [Nanoarchaeota archaeon]
MISVTTIFLFFIYLWGLGFSLTYFIYLKSATKPGLVERHIMNMGIGLGVFAILSIIINFFRIPLDWRLFLLFSLVIPLYVCFKDFKSRGFKLPTKFPKLVLTKSDLFVLAVFIIFAVSFYTYASGAFAYPYLEDEDPWGHSQGVKYVALDKDAYDPIADDSPQRGGNSVISFMDPYPPAYDIFLGVLHQTSPDLPWTMKFFNALIISLGFFFFYFFAYSFMQNKTKALLATFFLAVIPSYLSHFIWAHGMAITLIFPTLYVFNKIFEEDGKKWAIVLAVMVAGIWVTQNLSQPIKITTLLLIYAIVASVVYGSFLKYHFAGILGGMVLSQFWWTAMVQKYTLKGFIGAWEPVLVNDGAADAVANTSYNLFDKLFALLASLTNPGGTGSRSYTFSDFFVAKSSNLINAPIGIGIVLSLLALFGLGYLIFKYRSSLVAKENTWRVVALFWLIYTFWAVNGMTFPISIARDAFRSWFLLAIPVALIAAEGSYVLINTFRKNKLVQAGLILCIVVGVIATSGLQKYDVNTAIWPTSGSFMNMQEPFLYGELFKQIPLNSKVFLYAPRDKLAIGYGMFSCIWCEEIIEFRKDILHENFDTLYSFLKRNEYEYFLINKNMDYDDLSKKFGEEDVKTLLPERYKEFLTSTKLTPIYSDETVILFKVN